MFALKYLYLSALDECFFFWMVRIVQLLVFEEGGWWCVGLFVFFFLLLSCRALGEELERVCFLVVHL